MLYVILAYISYPLVYIASRLFGGRKGGSVLVFQTAKIGDMICATPVFREIKKQAGVRLGVVADPVTLPLLKYNPYVDEVIPFKREERKGFFGKVSFAYRLYKKGYSTALILLPNTANILAAFWSLTPKRVCVYPDFIGGTLKEILNLCTDFEYHIAPKMAMETYLSSLKHLGIKGGRLDKEVYVSPDAEEKFAGVFPAGGAKNIGLVISAGNPFKEWGRANFLALARRILDETGAGIVLFGYERDLSVGLELSQTVNPNKRVVNLCGTITLEELPSAIKRLALVIGVDTGLIYMADALGVPVVDIDGPCNMFDQRPLGKSSRIIQRIDLDCIPCSHTFRAPYECKFGDKRCITGISPDEVFKAVLKGIRPDGAKRT
ncbi:MAG: glycosyltransferase family 9 protein [Deltaproteobacteria bacterium]|nr:glycosyltransferase family 9 protein [Deltaproteobacteria bacterium]